MHKFKVGDKVELFKNSNWIGWVNPMLDMVGNKYTISEISVPDPLRTPENTSNYYSFKEDKFGYCFPEDCIRFVEQENSRGEIMFNVGDMVRVVKSKVGENPKRHKHADAIHAWAEGAEIEYLGSADEWILCSDPGFYEDYEYRVKPTEPEWWENIPEHGILVRLSATNRIYALHEIEHPEDWTPLTNEEIERFKR